MATVSAGPPVTVAVVSWNTRELLLRCLAALRHDVEAGRAHVVVVDNGSRDGSAAAARKHAPWAEVIEAPDNGGFGAAVNTVAARTTSQWLVAANADIAVAPGALERMRAVADADPRVGAVAPRLVLADGRIQHSVGPFPTLALALGFALGVHRISASLGDRLCLPDCWDPERARDVPWAVGACLLLRRAAFDAVGGFDERQWMYAEDLDLGWRLHDAGWLTRYEPGAWVAHAEAAATTQAFGAHRTPRSMRATYETIARRRGVTRARMTAAVNLAGTLARLAWMAPLALLSRGRRPALRSTWRWARAHRPGLHVTVPAAPVQRGKPPRPTDPVRASDDTRASDDMRAFWNARAREDAFYFVDTRQSYRRPEAQRFWDAAPLIDYLLEGLGVTLNADDVVLEIGCGLGRMTRVMAGRVRQVIALDVSDEMLARARAENAHLDNVRWVRGDGLSVAALGDHSVSACVSTVVLQHVPDPEITLGYVRELGRVLRPGGWAALQVSNDPAVHRPRDSRRARVLAQVGRAPGGQRHPAWLGSHVEIPDVRAAARQSGLELERVWGEGSQYCQLLLRAAAPGPE